MLIDKDMADLLGITPDMVLTKELATLMRNSVNSYAILSVAALKAPVFRQSASTIAALLRDDGEEVKAVFSKVFEITRPGITLGRGWDTWIEQADTRGTSGVYELLEEINHRRKSQSIPPLNDSQRQTIAAGLLTIAENTDIEPRHWEKLLSLIDPVAGDSPVVIGRGRITVRERFESVENEWLPKLLKGESGDCCITLKGGFYRGRKLNTVKLKAHLSLGGITPRAQDLGILLTAVKGAKKQYQELMGFRQHYISDHDIVKSYFKGIKKVTPAAVRTIRESLARSSRISLEIDPEALKRAKAKGRLQLDSWLSENALFWTGRRAFIFNSADGEDLDVSEENGFVLTSAPVLCLVLEDLQRMVSVSGDLRPGNLPYDAETEEIFSRMTNYLLMVARSPAHQSKMELSALSDIARPQRNVRETVEKILRHWDTNRVCSVTPIKTKTKNGKELLTAFSLNRPTEDSEGRPFTDTPEDISQSFDQMRRLVYEDWDTPEGRAEITNEK